MRTHTLENEYTDFMLREDIRSLLPPYPTNWNSGSASAYFSLDETHVYGAGAKMRYRFKIPSSEKDTTYKIEWDEVTTYPDGSVSAVAMSEELEGTGDPVNPVYGSEHEIDVPSVPCTKTVDNVKVSVVPNAPGTPGSGGPNGVGSSDGGGFGGGGCFSCASGGSGGSIGSGSAFSGPDFRISLGTADFGSSLGQLTFASPLPNDLAYSPVLLQFTTVRANVDVIKASGAIRQIKSPQTLADIITTSASSYEIRFYDPADVGALSSGLYPLIGTPTPFVTWRIENPNPVNNLTFRLTELRGGSVSRQWNYTYTALTKSWQVQVNNAPIEEEVYTAFGSSTRQQINVVRDPNNPAVNVLRTKRTYERFSWGEGLTEYATGEEGSLKKTTYTYYPYAWFATGGTRVPLESVTHPDGSWEYYAGYDGDGRPVTVYSSFGNVTLANYYYGRSTYYSYDSPSGSPDNGSINPDMPRMVEESLPGGAISRRYTIYPSAYVRLDIQCGDLGGWNAADNLITTNLFHTSGTNEFRLKAVIHPDHTMQTYDYTNSADGLYRTNITASGQPNASYTAVVAGTSNRMVLNQAGYPVATTSWDLESGIKIAQAIYSDFDAFGRPQQVAYLNGTEEHINYNCCNVESRIDQDGVQTFYGYDNAKRPVSSWRLGITNLNVLDPAGRVVQRVRIGTDSSAIVQTQYKFNSANELLAETNALNGVTSHTESFNSGTGELTHTTVYPDGGTRIEVHYRDGSLKQVTGTAVNPVRYEYGVENDGS